MTFFASNLWPERLSSSNMPKLSDVNNYHRSFTFQSSTMTRPKLWNTVDTSGISSTMMHLTHWQSISRFIVELVQLKPCVAWKIAISWYWHCQINQFETSILNILLRVDWNLEAEGTVVALAQQTFDQNKPNKIEIRLLFSFSPFCCLFVARTIYHTRSAQVTRLIGFWQRVAFVAFRYIICNDIGK